MENGAENNVLRQPWNRSQVMLLGGGKDEKTDLFDRMLRNSFVDTESNKNVIPRSDESKVCIKCLADKKIEDCNLILSYFDGLSVFKINHQVFLTTYGVYVVLFNMMDILDDNKKEQSLSDLSFWINSIVTHCRDANTRKIAPIFLVGTPDNVVNDFFPEVSNRIKNRFQYNAAWPYIQECKGKNICFFAIKSQMCLDNGVADLMDAIKCVVKEADYVKETILLTWLRALDVLLATKKSYLPLTEVTSIAKANGVEEDAVPELLNFLNKRGMLLWLDVQGLRDVVILDIITFLLEPATLIICNHISERSDGTNDHRNIQRIYEKEQHADWNVMTQRGLLSHKLLESLLKHKVEDSNLPVVISMMLNYGLIIRLEPLTSAQPHSDVVYYLVPTLLPSTIGDRIWEKITSSNKCYFVFTWDAGLCTSTAYDVTTLKNKGFLPRGLMDRLLCKAVKWCELNYVIDGIPRLYQNYAVMIYKRLRFRLACIPELNCIRLDIEGEHPLPVLEEISKCIEDCLDGLSFVTALEYTTEGKFVLVNLESITHFEDNWYNLKEIGIDSKHINEHYGPWLIEKARLPAYDVFISHRWHKDDDELVEKLYYSLVDNNSRAVRVFYDKHGINKGEQIQEAYGESLINATIAVPILCTSALQKMITHDPTAEDNVLIEWMLALECIKDKENSKLRHIYPLIFGERNVDGSVGNLSDDVIKGLPDIIPNASIKAVQRLLRDNGVKEIFFLKSLSG